MVAVPAPSAGESPLHLEQLAPLRCAADSIPHERHSQSQSLASRAVIGALAATRRMAMTCLTGMTHSSANISTLAEKLGAIRTWKYPCVSLVLLGSLQRHSEASCAE